MCLQHQDFGDQGAYYYQRHLAIISLGPLASGGQKAATAGAFWTEVPFSDRAPKGPLWRIGSVTAGHLHGVWSDGQHTLPIELVSVLMLPATSSDDDRADMPCGNRAFSLPRYTKPTVTRRLARLGGIAYTPC